MRYVAILLLVSTSTVLAAQADPHGTEVEQLKQELHGVAADMQEMRRELRDSQNQVRELQSQMAALLAANKESSPAAPPTTAVDNDQLATLQQQQQLLQTRVDQQYQTKVESGSKYRVRLSGLVLFNASSTRGAVDEQDVPMLAEPHTAGTSGGNISATMRQTLLNVDVFGPEIAGAKTSASMQLDFFGGFPNTLDGVTMGIARMRVARAQLDWDKWSLSFGQDKPFLSPNSPTSLASVAIPTFGYSGNLWTWTPEIVAERRWAATDNLGAKLQFGLMDPLSGEVSSDPFSRYPESGERSRTPALALRQSVQFGSGSEKSSIGIGGYFARHDYNFGRIVDAWAGTLDWNVILNRHFETSGQVFRGQALGGFWGGIGASVVFDGHASSASSQVFPVNSVGGWAQLKYRPASKWEINSAFGEDNPFASDLAHFNGNQQYAPYLRNWTTMFNVIERPRSNLMFSLEYRHLNTIEFSGKRDTAEHVNLGVGVSF